MDLLVNLERRETEVFLDPRELQVARESLALMVNRVLLALLVLLEFLVLKDKRAQKDQLVQLVRRETLD